MWSGLPVVPHPHRHKLAVSATLSFACHSLRLCEAKSLTSLKVQKAKGADPGEKRHNSEQPLGMETLTKDSHQSPVPAGSHGTGRARPRPLCRKSRLHPGLQRLALRPVLRYSVRLAISHRELRNTTDSPGSQTPRELLGSSSPPRRAGQRHRPSIVGAAGGTSVLGPGRDRAVTGGSCSPPVVGGPRLMRRTPRLVSHL